MPENVTALEKKDVRDVRKKTGPGKNCRFALGKGCDCTNPNGSGCLKKQKKGACVALIE